MPHIIVEGVEREYIEGMLYEELAKNFQDNYESEIVLAVENGKVKELTNVVEENARISFVTVSHKEGYRAYERGLTFLFLKAVYRVAGLENIRTVWVHFSISNGLYIEIEGHLELNQEFVDRVKEDMRQLVEKSLPIAKRNIEVSEGLEIFARQHMFDKRKTFTYRKMSRMNIYRMGEFENYFYGHMVPNTGYLKYFDLSLYDSGMVLQLPDRKSPTVVQEFVPQHKVFTVLKESVRWGEMLGIKTVGDLNENIAKGETRSLILVQEALQEKKLAEIASDIQGRGCKFVMLAGPSSSGKTTTAQRLAIQLRAIGMKPHVISVDNYFVNREYTPLDANGELDFEALECVDLELFNRDMVRLLKGDKVEIPEFNFKVGSREYKGDYLQLGREDILIIEGIHALNDNMSLSLPRESKYKVYLSALNQLSIDAHTRIPTTDGRLIRRIVRDARTRGIGARETIARWASVRAGEEKNIFPWQEDADVVFNSSLIYELSVLKCFAEPLLFHIPVDCPEYTEARRLLRFFDYFLAMETEDIPRNSILREFIGGSCFQV